MNDPIQDHLRLLNRRSFLSTAGLGVGGVALAGLLSREAKAANTVHKPLAGYPHFAPKAKRIIYLHMNGAPSQLDLWDHKPQLQAHYDKDLPESIRNGQRITTMTSGQARFPIAPSLFKFAQHGKSGRWISELLPHTSKVVDLLAVMKSVSTTAINHDPACTFAMTGNEIPGKPSIGSWISYGLGSESDDLPSFVVLTPKSVGGQALFTRMWSSGFLPTRHTGVALRSGGDPVLFVQNPPGVQPADRRVTLDALSQLNAAGHREFGDPETLTRTTQYEMAFRMQASVPDLTDLSKETPATLDLYGPEVKESGTFAHSALLARRMVERGVRFINIYNEGWDAHSDVAGNVKNNCAKTDKASAALIKDLKRRGLLDSTLVVWGGEFGRTPMVESSVSLGRSQGRDHHPQAFSMWMAGGGIKGGQTIGETDEMGFNIVKDEVRVPDLQATILHCLGIDHERLTFRNAGLDFRLTGVEPCHVVKKLLA